MTDPHALQALADRLLAADTADGLLAAVEDLLAERGALPAALYLHDGGAQSFYPVAGFARPPPEGELPSQAPPPEGGIVLRSQGGPVGLLTVPPAALPAVAELAALLGPVLVQLHQRQVVVEELRETREIVAHLAVAGDLLRHLDLEVLLAKVLEAGLSALDAQAGAVVLPEGERLAVRVAWGIDAALVDALRLADGRRLAEAVFADSAGLVLEGAELARRLDLAGLPVRLEALLALPLIARDRTQGVLLLANPARGCGPAKRRLADTLCSLAGTAIDNALLVRATIEQERLRQEIDIARSVQEKMFPAAGLALGDIRIEGWSRPCNETGGDYYTFVPRPGSAVAMVGDVSGHGLGAALFTTMAHALVQQQLRAGSDLAAAFRQINEGLYHMHAGRFMTAAAVEVDAASGRCDFVSAGHCRCLWIRGGEVRWLDSTAMPLGIMPALDIDPPPPVALSPGDLLLLYSDGIIEAADAAGNTLGEERLADTVLAAWRSQLPPRRVLELIAASVDGFTAGQPQADDLTAVAIVRAGSGSAHHWHPSGAP